MCNAKGIQPIKKLQGTGKGPSSNFDPSGKCKNDQYFKANYKPGYYPACFSLASEKTNPDSSVSVPLSELEWVNLDDSKFLYSNGQPQCGFKCSDVSYNAMYLDANGKSQSDGGNGENWYFNCKFPDPSIKNADSSFCKGISPWKPGDTL